MQALTSCRRTEPLSDNADAKHNTGHDSCAHSRCMLSRDSTPPAPVHGKQTWSCPGRGFAQAQAARARLAALAQADGPRLEPVQLVERAADGHVGDEVVDVVLLRGRARLLRHDRLRRREAVVRAPDGLAVADRQACRAGMAASYPGSMKVSCCAHADGLDPAHRQASRADALLLSKLQQVQWLSIVCRNWAFSCQQPTWQ